MAKLVKRDVGLRHWVAHPVEVGPSESWEHFTPYSPGAAIQPKSVVFHEPGHEHWVLLVDHSSPNHYRLEVGSAFNQARRPQHLHYKKVITERLEWLATASAVIEKDRVKQVPEAPSNSKNRRKELLSKTAGLFKNRHIFDVDEETFELKARS